MTLYDQKLPFIESKIWKSTKNDQISHQRPIYIKNDPFCTKHNFFF